MTQNPHNNIASAGDLPDTTGFVGDPFWHDASWLQVLESRPGLHAATSYLPDQMETKIFEEQSKIEYLRSSYKEHGYGYLFYALTKVLKPELCVEIGVLQGFSLLNVASALRENGSGMVHGFDLFEDYPYRHENYDDALGRMANFGLEGWYTLERSEATAVSDRFSKVDFLHVDISNNGDTFRQVFEQWAGKVEKVMMFEGGSASRDQVEWMIKYEKPSIVQALNEIRADYPEWDILVIDPYPSLTIALPAGNKLCLQLNDQVHADD
jgi:hypothetical protein